MVPEPYKAWLALVSELVYGEATRFDDPARFSFAHGGKDGHPFPVLTKTYDETIETMRQILNKTRLEHSEKRAAFRSLHQLTQSIEQQVKPDVDTQAVIDWERKHATQYDGRTVFDSTDTKLPCSKQLSLF